MEAFVLCFGSLLHMCLGCWRAVFLFYLCSCFLSLSIVVCLSLGTLVRGPNNLLVDVKLFIIYCLGPVLF